jgi:hypothetical protein
MGKTSGQRDLLQGEGFITESLSPTQVRVLLKGESHNPVLTVKGVYSSDIAFEKSWNLKEGI